MANKNAVLQSRIDRKGQLRTETSRRDAGEFDVAITTNRRNNSTRVFIDASGRDAAAFSYGADLELNGHQARTLYLALQKHFSAQGKSLF